MKITINIDDRYTETEIAVNCNRVSDDIDKLLAAIRLLDMKLTERKDWWQHILEASDVIYIDNVDKHTFLYTSNGVYESSLKLYELEAKLADRDFIRVNKNSLFNIKHIHSIEPNFDRRLILSMIGGSKLIVSRQYAVVVKEKLEAYYD